METLHPALVEEIVSRIPPQRISEAKFVCKTWEDILRRRNKLGILFSFGLEQSSYTSVNMFYQSRSSVQLYYGDFDDIKSIGWEKYSYTRDTVKIDHPPIGKYQFSITLVGSCNGLVCLTIPHHDLLDPVQVCNPYTGEYVNLPRLLIKHRGGSIVSGFGYLRSTNEYKVLRIYYASSTRNNIVGFVQVYTLGDRRGWREIGTIDYQVHDTTGFANESIYFVSVKREGILDIWGVVSFSLAKEEFRLLPSPPCISKTDTVEFDISILGGDLYCLNSNLYKFVELWSFKKKEECDDDSWNWNKEFNMEWPQGSDGKTYIAMPQLFGMTKSNEILYTYDGLYSYDPKTRTSKLLIKEDRTLEYLEEIPHINTTVSLKEMGERSKMRRRKIVESNVGQAQP